MTTVQPEPDDDTTPTCPTCLGNGQVSATPGRANARHDDPDGWPDGVEWAAEQVRRLVPAESPGAQPGSGT